MKQLLQQYAAYNVWANKLITERITQLSTEIIHKEMNSSFSSIYKTVVHLMDAESIWWQRLKLQEHVEWPGKIFNGNKIKLKKISEEQQQLLSHQRIKAKFFEVNGKVFNDNFNVSNRKNLSRYAFPKIIDDYIKNALH